MTKRPTETHTVEINGANATLKLSSKLWYVGVMLVLQLHRRDASKTLKVYGHKIAQCTSAMNVVELLKHVSKTVWNFHIKLSFSSFFSFILFFFFLSLFFFSFFYQQKPEQLVTNLNLPKQMMHSPNSYLSSP